MVTDPYLNIDSMFQMGFFDSKYAEMKEKMQQKQQDESSAPLKGWTMPQMHKRINKIFFLMITPQYFAYFSSTSLNVL